MPSWLARGAFVVAIVAALVAAGAASERREFGWVEWERAVGAGGARSAPSVERAGEGLRIGLAGGRVWLRVAPGRTAERVPVQVTVRDDGLERTGQGTFVVEEAGPFLAGRLEAEVDGRALRGGLRVRAQEPQ